MKKSKQGPLTGIKIVDLTSAFMGPYCTQVLSDLGADVIKVEGPEGDTSRWLPPGRQPDRGGFFINLNRGKRSILLDLKTDEGREALGTLLETADVFVHSIRHAAVQRLGFDYETIRARFPRLVYVSLYGFGRRGPYADFPAYDDVIQAACGLAMLQGELTGGGPQYSASTLADQVAGLTGTYAILAALLERSRSGIGQEVEVGMFETLTSFVMAQHIAGAAFVPPIGRPVYSRAISRYRKPYRTKDGYIAVMLYKDKHWRAFFDVLGNPDWSRNPKFSDLRRRTENIDELYGRLEQVFPTRTTSEWLEDLRKHQLPVMPLLTTEQLFSDEHLEAVGFWQDVVSEDGPMRLPGIPTTFSRTPGAIGELDRGLGAFTREVLSECGVSEEAIKKVLARAGDTKESVA